jgi:putative DNA primase/helicase
MSTTMTEPIQGRQVRPSLLADVVRFLDFVWRPGDVREVRIPQHNQWGHTASGCFDRPEKLLRAASAWDGKANIYVTINPVSAALLARAANRILAKAKNTTADGDILCRRFLFIDIDSIRPSGISATNEELRAAKAVLDQLVFDLSREEWPHPLTCLSGNGYYALYPLDLPNTAAELRLLEQVLKALAARYDTPAAKIDTGVANAARIVCLVGTMKTKGDSTEDRPHRRSSVLSVPKEVGRVSRELLENLAREMPPAAAPTRANAIPDPRLLRELLEEARVEYREQPPDAQGLVWYQIRICPFHGADHPYECGVGQGTDGHFAGKCFHDPGKGWQEWKSALGLRTGRTPSRAGDASGKAGAEDRGSFARTDAGNAEFFAELFADRLRYDHRRKSWLVWSGHCWSYDQDGAVHRLAIEAARNRYHRAEGIADLRDRHQEAQFAISTENSNRAAAMLRVAGCLPPLAEPGENWDQDPWLLGLKNGVVDLQTGTLRPGKPTDHITLATGVSYRPEAPCPRWLQFLDEIFVGDHDVIGFVQRVVGYSLTGLTTEQCLFMLHGSGANGKSLFLSVLRSLLGTYAYNAPFSTFELTKRSDITNDLASLAGRRLVTASETNEGARLNEARAKAITGCDPLTARFLYGENFTFRPVAKFFLAMNHLPVVTDDSYGFWRRVRLVPFTRQFTSDADPRLEEKLLFELPGIMAWAIHGCRAWQEQGLAPPAAVLSATADYKEKSDLLGEFLGDCLVADEHRSVGAAEAYGAYQTWARAQGMNEREMLTATAFGIKMRERFPGKKSKSGKRYLGVGLPGDPVQEVLG